MSVCCAHTAPDAQPLPWLGLFGSYNIIPIDNLFKTFRSTSMIRNVLGFLLLFSSAALAAEPMPPKWEATIAGFEKRDREQPVAPGQVLFVGSSSIVKWKTAESFPNVPLINRGFGGSQLTDVLQYFDRVVAVYKPRMIVLYAGDNDVGAGKSAETIAATYRQFAKRVRETLPETKILWVAIKPSPKRWALRETAMAANALVKAEIEKAPGDIYFDAWTLLLNDQGEPNPDYYVADKLHLSPAGYAVWNKALAPLLPR